VAWVGEGFVGCWFWGWGGFWGGVLVFGLGGGGVGGGGGGWGRWGVFLLGVRVGFAWVESRRRARVEHRIKTCSPQFTDRIDASKF